MKREEGSEAVPDTAEAWFARMRAGALKAEEQAAFDRWIAEDIANRIAFDKVSRVWEGMEAVRADPEVLAMRERARERPRAHDGPPAHNGPRAHDGQPAHV